MTRAGLIGAVVMLLLALGLSFVFGAAVPCCAIVVGLGAGYLAAMWEKPSASGVATKRGALTGAIAGIGAVVGQSLGGLGSAAWTGPEAASQAAAGILQSFGINPATSAVDPTAFYASAFGTGCCIGLFSLVLMAGLGALGGVIWWQTAGKSQGGALPA